MINITWSLTGGGAAISSVLDHGSSSNGSNTTAQEIYVRHDGAQKITNVGFYIRQFSGTYSGSFTAAADIAEILSWGDGADSGAFGGFQFNFNAVGTYPDSSWPIYSNKSPSGGVACRTGVGDSEANAIALPIVTGANTAGEIQSGETVVRFQTRMAVPDDEDTVGIRQWDSVLRYSFTS